MTPIEDVLLWAVAQKGKPYIFGAEARASDPNPRAFDCSELVQWACDRAGVTPAVPDGAYNQWRASKDHGLLMPVADAIRTRGACGWVGDGTGSGRGAITHVVFFLGDGTTVEARGHAWGVGTWPAAKRFDFAGLLPGIDYSPAPPPYPVPSTPPAEADMAVIVVPTGSGVPANEVDRNFLVGAYRTPLPQGPDGARQLAELEKIHGPQRFVSDLTWDLYKANAPLRTTDK